MTLSEQEIIEVSSPEDPRISDYQNLKDVSLRRRLEPELGLYMAESTYVIERALGAGHAPRSFLTAPKHLPQIMDVVAQLPSPISAAWSGRVPVFVAPAEVMEQITGFRVHRGALAAMHRPQLRSVGELLSGEGSADGPRRIVVLEDIVDHTNVGAIFRSVAALGADAVLVTPECADPLYRRSVRVSMGTVFAIPWTRIPQWPGGVRELQDLGYTVAGMTLGSGAITLDELVDEQHEKLAFVFGTEGHGLTRSTDELLDRRVKIPMMGGVDSLNVAAAAAVALYATR